MRRGEFNRYLDGEQQRAALLGRQWWAQRHVDIGMSGADERDAHGCPSCGELSGRHWIGCPVHIVQVLSRTPAKAVDLRTLFVLSI